MPRGSGSSFRCSACSSSRWSPSDRLRRDLGGWERRSTPLAQGSIGGTFHPVAGAFKPDTTKLGDCEGSFGCLEQAFGNVAYTRGPKTALRLFERRISEDDDVAADCPWEHLTCSNGVFMENSNTGFGFRSRWVDDENPLYPCNEVGSLDRRHCFARVSTRVLQATGNEFELAARSCADLARRWARQCFRGFGRDAVDVRGGPETTLKRCRLAAVWEGECLFGAARWVMDRAGRDGTRGAVALCTRAAPAVQDDCFRGIGTVLGLLNPSNAARRRACTKVTPRYVDACTQAAIAEVDPSAPEEAWG